MPTDFAVPLCLLMFGLPCMLAGWTILDKKDPYSQYMEPAFARETIAMDTWELLTERTGYRQDA